MCGDLDREEVPGLRKCQRTNSAGQYFRLTHKHQLHCICKRENENELGISELRFGLGVRSAMHRCTNAKSKMPKTQMPIQMHKCTNAQMHKCTNAQMPIQTPSVKCANANQSIAKCQVPNAQKPDATNCNRERYLANVCPVVDCGMGTFGHH